MKRLFSVLLVICTLISSLNGLNLSATATSNINYLSPSSAKEFLRLISNNSSYNPKSADGFYSLLIGEKSGDSQEELLMNAFLRYVYYCAGEDVYESRLNNFKNQLIEELPTTITDNIGQVLTDVVKDEMMEQVAGIGDYSDWSEGIKVLLYTITAVINIQNYVELAYFKATLGIPRDEHFELWASSVASFNGVNEKRKVLIDEWTLFTDGIEKKLLNNYSDDTENEETEVKANNVYFATSNYTIFYNYTLTNPATVYPYDATNKGINYYSGNTNIAKVDQNGKITPVNPGTVTIYAQADNGVTGSCIITILPFSATENNGAYTITDYIGNGTMVNIPSNVNGKPVTIIGDSAFLDCSKLTSVTIPDCITSIGDYAFKDCCSLTSVTIPDSVTNIGYRSFYHCSSLTSVTIPDSVTSIGVAFENCNSLTSITIPNSVTRLLPYEFSGCSSLISITIPNSVTSIGGYAFKGCHSLTSVTIPNGVTDLCGTFYNCSSLTSVIIPDSVTNISQQAFTNCSSLTSLTIPDGVTSISQQALSGCSSLTSILVGSNNSSYSSKDGVLFNKENTTLLRYPAGKTNVSYLIPDSVTSINQQAFTNCRSLTSITIPSSVTIIGDSAFLNCTSLTRINITDLAAWCKLNIVKNNDPFLPLGAFIEPHNSNPLCYGEKLYINENLATYITIPDTVTTIANFAFYNCGSLTSVIIPDNVKGIGSWTFSNCDSLTSVTIGNNVTNIGSCAFEYCSSLTSITIPDSVKSIGNNAFNGCDILTIFCNIGNVANILSSTDYKYKCFGDINDDKILNGTDTTKMRKALFGIFDSDFDPKIADMNQDNSFNILDLVRLKKTVAKV